LYFGWKIMWVIGKNYIFLCCYRRVAKECCERVSESNAG
jgi:hypothetical protein